MSETVKHTPGPWRVEQGTTLVWGNCNPDDDSNNGLGYPIIECRITSGSNLWAKGPDYDEGEANARLVATVPELLAALERIANANPRDEDMFALPQIAAAALAKATGGAS